MEEERVLLKQQKVQLNLLCAWNLIHEYQDPLGDCYFTQLKVDMRTLGAFQRNMYTVCPYLQPQQLFLYQVYIWICVPCVHLQMWWGCMHGERCHCTVRVHACCVDTQHTPEAFSPSACFPSISSFHSSEEQSQWLKDLAKVPCYAEERDTLTQLSISFAHLHVCGTLWINYVSRI